MNQALFDLILDCLEPKTLAYLVRDLEDSRAGWRDYPDQAPPDSLKNEMDQVIERLRQLGAKLTRGDEPDFTGLLEQARADLDDNWTWQRNQQIRQNWLQDLE